MNWKAMVFGLVMWIGAGDPAHAQSDCQERPRIRFNFDTLLLDRSNELNAQPLIFDAPVPFGNPILNASDLDFGTILGGRFELTLFDPGPNPLDYRIGYFFTETAGAHEARNASPADVQFFGGSAANPADTYTARYQSHLSFGDFNLRRPVSQNFGVSAGLGIGKLRESFDLLSSFSPDTGFFSSTTNELYGGQLSADALLWSNGLIRLEGAISGGLYYNDIEIHGVALNVENTWHDEETSFLGSLNLALVIPAWPFNFRVGYQAYFLTDVALAPDQSQALYLFDSAGGAQTDDVFYQGALIGIEFVR